MRHKPTPEQLAALKAARDAWWADPFNLHAQSIGSKRNPRKGGRFTHGTHSRVLNAKESGGSGEK